MASSHVSSRTRSRSTSNNRSPSSSPEGRSRSSPGTPFGRPEHRTQPPPPSPSPPRGSSPPRRASPDLSLYCAVAALATAGDWAELETDSLESWGDSSTEPWDEHSAHSEKEPPIATEPETISGPTARDIDRRDSESTDDYEKISALCEMSDVPETSKKIEEAQTEYCNSFTEQLLSACCWR